MYRLAPREILTERLSLRPLGPEHASLVFYTYASKAEVTRYLLWQPHQEIEETYRFLKQCQLGWRAGQIFLYGIWTLPHHRLIGSISVQTDPDCHWNLGYALSPTAWGMGFATEAATGLIREWRYRSGALEFHSFIHPENKPSGRVLEKAGFQQIRDSSRTAIFPNADPQEVPVIAFVYR